MTEYFTHIHPIFLLFFFYGAAFLFMGFSIVVKDMKGSDLRIADNLWLPGMFGFRTVFGSGSRSTRYRGGPFITVDIPG